MAANGRLWAPAGAHGASSTQGSSPGSSAALPGQQLWPCPRGWGCALCRGCFLHYVLAEDSRPWGWTRCGRWSCSLLMGRCLLSSWRWDTWRRTWGVPGTVLTHSALSRSNLPWAHSRETTWQKPQALPGVTVLGVILGEKQGQTKSQISQIQKEYHFITDLSLRVCQGFKSRLAVRSTHDWGLHPKSQLLQALLHN